MFSAVPAELRQEFFNFGSMDFHDLNLHDVSSPAPTGLWLPRPVGEGGGCWRMGPALLSLKAFWIDMQSWHGSIKNHPQGLFGLQSVALNRAELNHILLSMRPKVWALRFLRIFGPKWTKTLQMIPTRYYFTRYWCPWYHSMHSWDVILVKNSRHEWA